MTPHKQTFQLLPNYTLPTYQPALLITPGLSYCNEGEKGRGGKMRVLRRKEEAHI